MEISFQAASFDALGQRFASVSQGLDVQKLTISQVSSENSLVWGLPKGIKVTSLIWASPAEKSKKRKRMSVPHAPEDLVVMGSAAGKVLVFSASKQELLTTLDGTQAAILDLCYCNGALYAVTDESELIKWDIQKQKPLDSWAFDAEGLAKILPLGPEFVLTSTMPHIAKIDSPLEILRTLPGFTTPIHQLSLVGDGFAASAEEDRQVQVYSQGKNTSFMCPSNVVFMASNSQDIAVVCEDGKARVYRAGAEVAVVHIRRSSGATVAIHNVQFADDFLVVAWPEAGASVAGSERVKWLDGEEPIPQITSVCDPAIPAVTDHTTNGVDSAAPAAYKEAHTTVTSGNNFKALDEDSDEEEVTLADRLEALEVEQRNGDDEDEDEDEDDTKDKPEEQLKISAPGSFTVLLNQALASDDKQLLETCLAEKDEKMIKSSIIRLDPALATKLLERLAKKISRAQNRSARLLTWIRWVMVVHGGYLVTVPSLLKTLASLYATLSARTATLPKLLALQGRLDLLSAQMDLRQEIIDSKRNVEEDDDAPEFVYNEEEIIANGEEDLDAFSQSEEELEEDLEEEDEDEEMDESE